MTDARRIDTPPGSVLVLRLNDLPLDVSDVEPMAAELHRQTGLPVLITDGTTEVDVTTQEEAVRALAEELFEEPEPDEFQLLAARRRLRRLGNEGWLLVRVRP